MKQHEMWYDRLPQAGDRDQQGEYADWFRTVEWDWYMTLTFDREVGVEQAWGLLREYLDLLETRFKCPLPALMVLEHKPSGLGKPGGGHHFHIVMKGPTMYWGNEDEIMEEEWCRLPFGGARCKRSLKSKRKRLANPEEDVSGGAAEILPYDPQQHAVFYLFKGLHLNPDDWQIRGERYLLPKNTPPPVKQTCNSRRLAKRYQERRARTLGSIEAWDEIPAPV